MRKSSNIQNLLKFLKELDYWSLMPEMENKNKLGVITLVSEISSVVHHAKLPNFVIVAVLGFICFLKKMKAFRPLAERCYEEIIFEWIH